MHETEQLRFALENAFDAIYIYDRIGRIHFANKAACRVLGYDKDELTGMNVRDLDPEFSEVNNLTLWRNPDTRISKPQETVHIRKDGSTYPVEIFASASVYKDEQYAVAFVRDISERIRTEVAFKEEEERFRVITDTSPVALIISRISDGQIRYANKQAKILFTGDFDWSKDTIIMKLFQQCRVETEVINFITSCAEVSNREIILHRGNETPIWVSLNTKLIELQGEQVMCSVMLDVTEARELSNQLSYQATYDDLTGLVNRREFEDRLQEVIEIAHERGAQSALCYLDLDQFKIINDTCGHMAGDELLKQLSQLLSRCIRRDDTLARLGGDEFAILLENCPLKNAEKVANKVRQAIQDFRFQWHDNTFNISVSIGLAPIVQDGESITDVLRQADAACYAAKDAGRNRVHVFSFNDEKLAQRHGEMQWVSRINSALNDARLELWIQKISPAKEIKKSCGHFEVLLRMRDEDGSLIYPGAFLPAAERYDLATRLDHWVVNEIFEWFNQNPDELEKLNICSINLSGQTLGDEDFLNHLIDRFQFFRIPPQKVCFEITETAAIANLAHATHFMKSLKSLGCSFALDDFGSGLSSFAYLKNLPVDYVKIDGFFVKDITSDAVDLAMVKAINDMAHAMGKMTIAEFVENGDILRELLKLGIDYVQGYGIARPTPLRNK